MIEFRQNTESKYDDYKVYSLRDELLGYILKEDHGYYFSSHGPYLMAGELRQIADKLEELNS